MWLLNWFRRKKSETAPKGAAESETKVDNSMKYLIVGLGNIGSEYAGTRHNIGFRAVDAFAEKQGVEWADKRYGFVAKTRVKNAELILLKPSTYMNLSGQAVRYWAQQEKIPVERILVIVDDLSLPVGKIRMRGSGSAGGHNGLKNIESCMMTQNYARIKFGIGNEFPKGTQIDFVLGKFSDEDNKLIAEKLDYVGEMIQSFCLQGLDRTMNQYNKK
jgi:PTH1 family peptidyl-tRNA hydrolase